MTPQSGPPFNWANVDTSQFQAPQLSRQFDQIIERSYADPVYRAALLEWLKVKSAERVEQAGLIPFSSPV